MASGSGRELSKPQWEGTMEVTWIGPTALGHCFQCKGQTVSLFLQQTHTESLWCIRHCTSTWGRAVYCSSNRVSPGLIWQLRVEGVIKQISKDINLELEIVPSDLFWQRLLLIMEKGSPVPGLEWNIASVWLVYESTVGACCVAGSVRRKKEDLISLRCIHRRCLDMNCWGIWEMCIMNASMNTSTNSEDIQRTHVGPGIVNCFSYDFI